MALRMKGIGLSKRKDNSEQKTYASWKQVTGGNVMASYTVNLDILADVKVILLWQIQIFVEDTV